MAMSRPPGGGRFISDEMRTFALAIAGIFLLIFFLLVIRNAMDANGPRYPLKPTRGPGPLLRSMMEK